MSIQDQVVNEVVSLIQDLNLVGTVRAMEEVDYDHYGIAVVPKEEILEGATMERDLVGYPCQIVYLTGATGGYNTHASDISAFRQSIRRTFHNQDVMTFPALESGACYAGSTVRPSEYLVPRKYRNNVRVSAMLVITWVREARS